MEDIIDDEVMWLTQVHYEDEVTLMEDGWVFDSESGKWAKKKPKIKSRSIKTTSIALGDHFVRFLAQQMDTGRYGSSSEIVREAMRLLEQRELKLESIRSELDEARSSRVVDMDDVVRKIRRGE